LYFYGGTYVGLAKKLHIPVAEAEQFFRDFKAVYPTLSRWFADNADAPFRQRATRLDGSSVGYIATYAGLRRWFELPRLGADSAEVWKQRGADPAAGDEPSLPRGKRGDYGAGDERGVCTWPAAR
jgi:hypothetical protein